MLAEERFSLILDLLARQRTATVQELCEALERKAESTIRRDLTELDRQGRLTKVHGGATLPDSPLSGRRAHHGSQGDTGCGRKAQHCRSSAAALITAEDFVFIDAGTTTLELVRALTGVALKAPM